MAKNMSKKQIIDYLSEIDAWAQRTHTELGWRFSVYTIQPPPRLSDYQTTDTGDEA